jgi:hypothetical protein
MTDPKKFLSESLIDHSAGFARKMFNSRRQLRPQYYGTADGLYTFAQNFATDGIKRGTNGLPRARALQSLEMIANHFQVALSESYSRDRHDELDLYRADPGSSTLVELFDSI